MEVINLDTNKDRVNAVITGVFYLVAAITSVVALKLYEPILYNRDYLLEGAKNSNQILLGAFFELLLVGTVAGTGIMLFPYLRKFNESMALGYLCFRLLEAILILVGILSVLSLLTLSKTYVNAFEPEIDHYKSSGSILKAIHDWTFMLGPNFMLSINNFLYSYIFYRSGLIPRKIAVIGLIGAIFLFIASLLELFGIIAQISVWGALLAIPIFVFEMTLAFWLIKNGFNLNNLIE